MMHRGKSEETPPTGNTGVQKPVDGSPLAVTTEAEVVSWHVDWLEVTYPDGADPFGLLPGIERGAWRQEERGRLGYSVRFSYGLCQLLTGGRPGMGTHISLGGTAIRYLEARPETACLDRLLDDVASGRAGCSRVDYAIDILDGSVTPARVKAALVAGEYTSRWDCWQEVNGYRGGRGQVDGSTIYVGAPSSDTRCRIYDKLAERRAKGKREEALGGGMPDSWTRIEYQLRNSAAEASVRVLRTSGGLGLSEALLGYLAIRQPNTSDRRTRWEVAGWWANAIGAVKARPLCVPQPAGDLSSSREWVETQAAPTLAALMMADGGDIATLRNLALAGRGRIGPKLAHRLEAAGYQALTRAAWEASRKPDAPNNTDSPEAGEREGTGTGC